MKFFILIARLSDDPDMLKQLVLGLAGLTAFLSNIEHIIRIVVPIGTLSCMIYLAWKKGKLIDRELEENGIKKRNDENF